MESIQEVIMDTDFHESRIWESQGDAFNYIEEASDPNKLPDSEVDGIHILARVEGPAFFPETVSEGNNVYYPQEAWESAISAPEFKRLLADRLIYGTIGHNIELTDDEIREGKFSHVLTRVWINEENIGRAEYLIYNTDPGRYLNMLLRTRSKLRVSTKAAGRFEKTTSNGVKKVIPSTFKLERIDFVIDPGYKEALPAVIESKLDILTNNTEEGPTMDNKVVEILEARIQELKGETTMSASSLDTLRTELQQIRESSVATNILLDSYKALGTPAAIQEALSTLTQYAELGTVHEINEAFDAGEEQLDQMTDTITGLQDQLETPPDEYKELGEPEEIKIALSQALDAVDTLQQYQQLGTPEELTELVSRSEEIATSMETSEKQTMADKYGVDVGVIGTMCEKGLSLTDCDEILAATKGAPVSEGDMEGEEEELGDAPPAGDTPPAGDEGEEGDPDLSDEEDEEEKLKALTESRSSKALRRLRTNSSKIKESRSAKPVSLAQRLITRR